MYKEEKQPDHSFRESHHKKKKSAQGLVTPDAVLR